MEIPTELVRQARRGDAEALEELISRSYRAAYTLAYRLMGNRDDAAEATQEAFVRIVRNLKRLDEEAAFRTWMFKIVSNVCVSELRRRNRREVPTDVATFEIADRVDAEDMAISRVLRVELDKLIADLPETYRSVVVLRDVYGMSGDETAEVLGISSGAVKVRLHRARRSLRDALLERFPDWGVRPGKKESA